MGGKYKGDLKYFDTSFEARIITIFRLIPLNTIFISRHAPETLQKSDCKNGNDTAAAKKQDNIRTIYDTSCLTDSIGPIAGLYTLIHELPQTSAADRLLAVAPCDTPDIRPGLYRTMFHTLEEDPQLAGVIPYVNGNYYPLNAVYRISPAWIDCIEQAVRCKRYGVYRAISSLPVKILQCDGLSVTQEELNDIDTLEEYEKYQHKWSSKPIGNGEDCLLIKKTLIMMT